MNGGGKIRRVLTIIAMSVPQIVTTTTGPAVFHSDFTPVTIMSPAKAGEVLISMVSGMGPTVPGVDPGEPFPSDSANALQRINSPMEVTVNGDPVEVINAIAWPGLTDRYRVDFPIPQKTVSGTATIQLSAAWISGVPFNIPIQ
jgi:uncharacterized protein (TIGR03437 family)